MKRTSVLASLAAALLLSTFAAPALAERLYVPLVGGTAGGRPLATSVWVTSTAPAAREVTADFVGAAGRRATRSFDLAAGSRQLASLAAPGAAGLLALDGDAATVFAWLAARADGDPAEVPVIGAQDVYAAGASPALDLAAGSGPLRVGAANLGDAAATCRAQLSGESERSGVPSTWFTVPPKSFAAIDIAAGDSAAAPTARVTCDQPFYPLAVTTGDDLQVIVAKGTGPNGNCDRWLTLAPQPDGSWLAAANGNFHQATTRDPKGVLCIRAPQELHVARAVYDWDVVAGPWWKKKKDGIHNLGYFFGERYRSGVIGNVNTIGTRNQLKFMQNYDMPQGTNTNVSAAFQMQQGAQYHASYTFDAEEEQATLQLFRGGAEVKSLSQQTHAGGSTLLVRPFDGDLALIAEFGNYAAGRGVPEVPTIGWTYANFQLRLYPK